MAARRFKRRTILSKNKHFTQDGILLVDKPAGLTSHDVVARVRKLLGTRRVGHTGTLDPFATGLLVICLNRATRLVQFLTGAEKAYQAVVRFGWATDTGDLTGRPLSAPAPIAHLTETALQAAAHQLRGRIFQTPPMYSAKKIGGVKLYELARQGETIQRSPVEIVIKELSLGTPRPVDSPAILGLDVPLQTVCSAGTYVRVLAEDLGKQLGVGAHLTELRRTRVGHFSLSAAFTLEQLAEIVNTPQITEAVIPLIRSLPFPKIVLNEAEQQAVAHGRAIQCPAFTPGCDGNSSELAERLVRLSNPSDELLAIARYDSVTQAWQPCIVLCEPRNKAG